MPGDFTVGVEEEYQLVDAATGELRSRAGEVLRAHWTEEISPEFHETMLEVGTPVCQSASEVHDQLARLRLQTASAAEAADLRIVAAGLHPFSRWEGQRVTPSERYQRLLTRFGRVVRTEHVFGMHVHVGIAPGTDRMRLINALRQYLPHLAALAASSPIYEGEDTGYHSYRTILSGRLPHSGIPPHLESEEELERFLALLTNANALEDGSSLYWNIRPHPRYPTLEFRATDVCPRLEDAAALAALMRTCVVAAAEGRLRPFAEGFSASARHAILQANEWQAARFGLDAVLADPGAPSGRRTARDGVEVLIETVLPVAEALGDADVLAGVSTILDRGTGADRIRATADACPTLEAVVDWLAGETLLGTGLDRRREQREACG
jgi:glutamate---cysteine ligase / carboxylate-amine ligase